MSAYTSLGVESDCIGKLRCNGALRGSSKGSIRSYGRDQLRAGHMMRPKRR